MAQNIEINILSDISKTLKEVEILVKAGNSAEGSFKKLGNSINDSFKQTETNIKKNSAAVSSLTSGFKALGATILASAAAFAAGFSVRATIGAAIEQEEATNRLAGALRAAGDSSSETFERFVKLGDEMQRTTKFGDDLILNQLAISKSFGATDEQAEKIVKTAANLSAAFGVDLETAVRELNGTLAGTKGRLVGRIAELQGISQESLKAGAAIDILAQKFDGFAQKDSATFGGAIAAINISIGEFLESIGMIFTQNAALLAVINAFKDGFFLLADAVNSNSAVIGKFISDTIITLLQLSNVALKVTGFLSNLAFGIAGFFINALGGIPILIGKAIGGITALGEVAEKIIRSFLGQDSALADGIKSANQFGRSLQGSFDGAGEAIKEFSFDISKTGKSSKQFLYDLGDGATNLVTKISKTPIKINNVSIEEEKLKKQFNNVSDEAAKKLEEKLKKAYELGFKNPIKGLIDSLSTAGQEQAKLQQGAAFGLAGQLSKGFASGAAGASSFITSIATGLLSVLGPFGEKIAEVAGPLIELLGKSEEEVRAQIQGFADGLVTFIQNFITNIPVIVEEIAKAGPRIIEGLIAGIPEIISSLAESMPQAAIAFANQMPLAAIQFATSLSEQAPNIARALIEAIPKAGSSAVSSGGGIFKKLGFAKGGSPSVRSVGAGFPNDTFPINVSSHELIVDRSTSSKLKDFLDNSGQVQRNTIDQRSQQGFNQEIVIQIDGRTIARAMRDQVKSGFAI